jgi:hypothetical protein
MTEYYVPGSGAIYTEENLQANTGYPPSTSPEVLAARGIYEVVPTPDPYDPSLYTTEPSFTIVGYYANESWVATPLPLPDAKANATAEVKTQSNAEAAALITASGVNVDIWTGAASQDPLDRPPVYNTLLGEMATIGDTLATNLTAIDAATSVDELNAIVHQPSGLLDTGRGGTGQAGPLDLNLTYFSEIYDLPGITQADLELYVPGTDTVIPYDEFLPDPYRFDSVGDCFNTGDYRLVIRYAGGGAVLSTITVPEGDNTEVPWTYNPVIPAAPGGGGSSVAE